MNHFYHFVFISLAFLFSFALLTQLLKHVGKNKNGGNDNQKPQIPDIAKPKKPKESILHNLKHETTHKFLQSQIQSAKCFLHFTEKEWMAENILLSGFRFADELYNTTQLVTSDKIDLTYKLNCYKEYGSFIALICIPNQLYDFIVDAVEQGPKDISIEMLLAQDSPMEELNYRLPSIFSYGYINLNNLTIIKNDDYLKGYSLVKFQKEIENAKGISPELE